MQILQTEVSVMRQDPIWQAFSNTGDPLYYLLFCAVREKEREERQEERKTPRSTAVRS